MKNEQIKLDYIEFVRCSYEASSRNDHVISATLTIVNFEITLIAQVRLIIWKTRQLFGCFGDLFWFKVKIMLYV